MHVNQADVQGTCKYGTRVDYILGSQGLNYAFVPGSYSVVSSKGTSDHHIVKVDVLKVEDGVGRSRSCKKLRQKFVRMSSSCSSRGDWEISSWINLIELVVCYDVAWILIYSILDMTFFNSFVLINKIKKKHYLNMLAMLSK